MAEMSEGVPKVETKAPVVGRVSERIFNLIKSQMPSAHAERYFGLWKKVTGPLEGKSKDITGKLDPVMRVASKSLGIGTSILEAELVAAAVVIPTVLGGDKVLRLIKSLQVSVNTSQKEGAFIFKRIRESVEGRVGKKTKEVGRMVRKIVERILQVTRIKQHTETVLPVEQPPDAIR